MVYVALLRGINVGGHNKVDMKQLKTVFEELGMTSVRTYINSGNVIFSTAKRAKSQLAAQIEKAIARHFGFNVEVVVRDRAMMKALVKRVPKTWTDDKTQRCYVMFLWDDVNRPSVLKQLSIKPDMDEVRYASGAIVWRVDRKHLTKSGMMKLTSAPLYKRMTIRNINTTRKLVELMEA